MTKPPRLRPGDTVGVIAPGGVVRDRAGLDRGIAALERLGYRVRCGATVNARAGYLAGDEGLRRGDLLGMFAAEDVRAIFCARGGYGVTRLLPTIDLVALLRRPKIFVGYSDVSPLLVALVQRGGMVAFHGPMVAADLGAAAPEDRPSAVGLDEQSTGQLMALLGGAEHTEVVIPRTVRSGVARGTLVGGCLSLLAATTGTPYALRGEGTVLFIEDVGEAPYRIDRMLTQLEQAGVFAGVRAVVFGVMTSCGDRRPDDVGIDAVIEEFASRQRIPVGAGVPSGHGRPNFTLPFGVEAEVVLDGDCGVVRIDEPAVE
jgi:muramoyltetrapeptide carboxypeptidase